MPDPNYPKEWWRYCTEHDDWDTNGDGACRVYGAASRRRREQLDFCRLLGHGRGRRP